MKKEEELSMDYVIFQVIMAGAGVTGICGAIIVILKTRMKKIAWGWLTVSAISIPVAIWLYSSVYC